METVATAIALTAAILNGLAAVVAGWLWWVVDPRQIGWVAIRIGQAASIALAGFAAVAYVAGARPEEALFWLYAVLPVAIGVFAEQFRLLSAQTVLDARGLPDAQAVGALPEAEQRSIVLQIVRRELGIMAVAAGVNGFLALRSITEVAGL